MELTHPQGLFLRFGLEEVKMPKWKTMAFLVDGGLQAVAQEVNVNEVMVARLTAYPEARTKPPSLTLEELKCMEKHLEGQDVMRIGSVVKSAPGENPGGEVQKRIEQAKKSPCGGVWRGCAEWEIAQRSAGAWAIRHRPDQFGARRHSQEAPILQDGWGKRGGTQKDFG